MSMNPGDIVVSKAGRDKGKPFIVAEVTDESYVLLVNGSLRKIEKPKKKKVRHIRETGFRAEEIAGRLTGGEKVINAEIRKAIKAYEEKAAEPVDTGEA